MLRREGKAMNLKKIYRLYREERDGAQAGRSQAGAGNAGAEPVISQVFIAQRRLNEPASPAAPLDIPRSKG